MSGVTISVVRSVDDLMQVFALRALSYMGEQHCPYGEEFDGNDLCGATHLIGRVGGEPVACMRIRWFAGFAKFERICVHRRQRGSDIARRVIDKGFAIAARKNYTRVLVHVQERLLPHWEKVAGFKARPRRARFRFSDLEYLEAERVLEPGSDAITIDTDALTLLRPEGAWDEPGVLDRSSLRALAGAAP